MHHKQYGLMAAAILATMGAAVPVRTEPLSDEDFTNAYNALEPVPYDGPDPSKAKPVRRSHVSISRPPVNTEHEMAAWERRKSRERSNSPLAKARRAKSRL